MNFLNIYDEVEARRPLSLLSSLPVIIRSDDILEVMWFYFNYQDSIEEGNVQITGICTTKDGETITEQSAWLKEDAPWNEGAEPEIDETDYYDQLEELYEDFDEELMEGLLQNAEQPTFLSLYKKVTEYLENLKQNKGDLVL